MAAKTMSIVVTVVEGGRALETLLELLANQKDAPPLEVIVPYDDTIAEVATLAPRFPQMTFASMGQVPTLHDKRSAAGMHELFDRRRAVGLGRATGELVGMLEDRCLPRTDWAKTAARLHEELPHAVIGGAVECGIDRTANWALYFCDYGRYQPPFEAGPRDYVTDVNVCYKRAALEATKDLWRDRYHETTVHWALAARGETLYLTPELVVDHIRRDVRLLPMVAERFHWGRLFAYTRARECSAPERLKLVGMAPLLPAVLLARHGRLQLEKGNHVKEFAKAAPMMVSLLVPWSLGELWGYATKKP